MSAVVDEKHAALREAVEDVICILEQSPGIVIVTVPADARDAGKEVVLRGGSSALATILREALHACPR